MKRESGKSNIDGLLVLVLFCVFAVCVLSVLLSGADTYRKLTQRDQTSYDSRTAVQYLATRVRQADRYGGIRVGEFDGLDALVLTEEIEGTEYQTQIYCYDGYLFELFASVEGIFAPEDGEKILPAQDLALELEERILRVRLTDSSGRVHGMNLHIRSGEEAVL